VDGYVVSHVTSWTIPVVISLLICHVYIVFIGPDCWWVWCSLLYLHTVERAQVINHLSLCCGGFFERNDSVLSRVKRCSD